MSEKKNGLSPVDITLTDSYQTLIYRSVVATQPRRGAVVSPQDFMLKEPKPYHPPKDQQEK